MQNLCFFFVLKNVRKIWRKMMKIWIEGGFPKPNSFLNQRTIYLLKELLQWSDVFNILKCLCVQLVIRGSGSNCHTTTSDHQNYNVFSNFYLSSFESIAIFQSQDHDIPLAYTPFNFIFDAFHYKHWILFVLLIMKFNSAK